MQLITLTDEPKQKLDILFEDTVITVEFRFNPTIVSWTMNIIFRDVPLVNGKSVALGLPLLKEFNKPFDLVCLDNKNTGIDPFQLTDFSSNRVSLYLLNRDEVEQIRGYDVI